MGKAKAAPNFPNPTRVHDASKRCLCSWGYDNAREIVFQIDDVALARLGSGKDCDEPSLLAASGLKPRRDCRDCENGVQRRPEQQIHRLLSNCAKQLHTHDVSLTRTRCCTTTRRLHQARQATCCRCAACCAPRCLRCIASFEMTATPLNRGCRPSACTGWA
nr:DUF1488 family protein [Paraburkholderia azotifigens]